MKPSEALRSYSRLSLTDNDFAWIGAVVSHWTVAEHYLEVLIGALASVDEAATKDSLIERSKNFDSQIKLAKTLLKSMCSGFCKHQEIGRLLMIEGKKISVERNKFAHWLTQRGDNDTDILFIDFSWRTKWPEYRDNFSEDRIKDLTIRILNWLSDVTTFIRYLLVDGPLASRTKWNGPKPVPATLEWDEFRTIQQTPQSGTRRMPTTSAG